MVDVTIDETTFEVLVDETTYSVSVSQNAIAGAIADLTDTIITNPINGEALTYNGSAWVNQAGAGLGDMTKVVYDTDNDGTVDSADTAANLTGVQADAIVANTAKVSNVDHPLVETAVPLGAVFTDTVYDDTAIQAEVDLNTAKTGITAQQASDITTNNAKISYTDSAAVALNTAKVSFDSTSSTRLANTSGTNTGDQVIPQSGVDFDPVGTDNSDDNATNTTYDARVTANDAKISYTDSAAVTANTAKVSADGSIGTHSDVDLTDEANGKVLTFNSTSGNWEAETPASGVTDHTLLSNIGTKSHATLDSEVAANNDKISFTWDYDYGDLINTPTTITGQQATDITTNNAKVSFDWDYDYADLINTPTTISAQQATDITTNNAKVTYDDAAIVASNAAFTATPSTVITAGTDLSWSGNTLNYTGSGGGITWATPIDSSITVDTDSTYNIGTSTVKHAKIYADDMYANTIREPISQVTWIDLNSYDMGFYADGSLYLNLDNPSNTAVFNPYSTDLDFVINGDSVTDLFKVDAGNDTVTIKNLNLATGMDAGSFQINNVADPTLAQDVATKKYVDDNAGGGGITWSTPIDSSITVDTDSTYDIGTSTALVKDIYADQLFVQDKITANGDTDTYIDFSSDNHISFYAGNTKAIEIKESGDHYMLVNPNSANFGFAVHGDSQNFIINTDPGNNSVSIKNLNLSAEMDAGAHSIGFTLGTATGDGTTTIDWGNGNKFKFTFGAFNETFTFTAPANPGSFQMIMVQDATGGRTATFPATVKWAGGTAPTLSTAANAVDIISFFYDGTNYYGGASLDFS